MRAVNASLLSYDLQPESKCNPSREGACRVTMDPEQFFMDGGLSDGDAVEDCTIVTASM